MNRPLSEWCPSSNFTPATKARGIVCVVIHATATGGLESPKAHLCDPCPGHEADRVSAHYLIGRDGQIVHLVHESNIAWHAGESAWKGRSHVNQFSVGIEMVNTNDGKMEYPDAQLVAAAALTAAICRDYEVRLEDVVGHADIAPGRKTDPAGFPWADFRARLRAAGIA